MITLFFFNDTATTEIYTLPLHDALPIFNATGGIGTWSNTAGTVNINGLLNNAGNTLTLNTATGSWTLNGGTFSGSSVEHTSGLHSPDHAVCRLLLDKKKVNDALTLCTTI